MRDPRCIAIVLGLLSLLAAGCAGTRPARELSRETLSQVVEYEQQVREASRLLQAYYRRVLKDVGDDYKLMQNNIERSSRAVAAEDAVDRLIADGYSAKRFRDYLTDVAEATASERARYATLRGKLIAAENQAIKDVTVEESALKVTRSKLEFLQREPSLRDRADQIGPLLEAAMKALRPAKPTTGGGS
jgi:hypothetical protein